MENPAQTCRVRTYLRGITSLAQMIGHDKKKKETSFVVILIFLQTQTQEARRSEDVSQRGI